MNAIDVILEVLLIDRSIYGARDDGVIREQRTRGFDVAGDVIDEQVKYTRA